MGDILKEGVDKRETTWQKVKRVCHYITTVLMYSICLIMIIIFMAFIVNFVDQRNNLSKGLTKPSLFSAYTIVSPSMVPNINVLDIVIVKRVEKPETLEKGDIITFNSTDYRYSGVTVTHRITNIETTTDGKYLFTTKGDANNTPDSSRISFEEIYGQVLFRIPKIGYIQYFLSNAVGWVILIICPAVAIIAYDIIKLIRTIKQKNNLTTKKETSKKEKTSKEVVASTKQRVNSVKNSDKKKQESKTKVKERRRFK